MEIQLEKVLNGLDTKVGQMLDGQRDAFKRMDVLEKADRSTRERVERIEKHRGLRIAEEPSDRRSRVLRGATHFLLGVLGHQRDQHFKIAEDLLGEPIQRALQEDTGSEGGFLVPTELAREVLVAALTLGSVRSVSRSIPMRAKVMTLPSVSTKPTVAWIAEEATITTSDPVLAQLTLTAKKLCARTIVSLELEQDSAVQIGEMLVRLFSESCHRGRGHAGAGR